MLTLVGKPRLILILTMRLLQQLLGCFMVLLAVITLLPTPTQAASSAAIRAYDDVAATTKDYSGQNLVRAEFANVQLTAANFQGADLQGAVFNGSTLTQANLQGINFSNGIAYLSDLSKANLSDAILTSAMLLKSNFRGAIVTGADFTDAVLDREQVLQLCQNASGTNSVTGADTRESLGCK